MKYKIRPSITIAVGLFFFLVLKSLLFYDPKGSTDIFKAIVAATAGGILAGLTSYCIMWLSEVLSAYRKQSENIEAKK